MSPTLRGTNTQHQYQCWVLVKYLYLKSANTITRILCMHGYEKCAKFEMLPYLK